MKLPGIRDIRIEIENAAGEWVDVTGQVAGIDEVKEPTADAPEPLTLGTAWTGTATFTASPEGARRLWYWLVVRPTLWSPLEYRLN